MRGVVLEQASTDPAIDSMHGFTGAEIEQVVLDALYAAFAEGRAITAEDIVQAAPRVKPIVRAVGSGLDEVWSLIDQGRVELASDQFLTRSDLAKLIDPTLFSPMYCRMNSISGWEKHAARAERLLMIDPLAPRAAAFMSTGDAGWLYVQTNVRYSERDQHDYKFLDEVETIAENGVLDMLITDLGVEIFVVETEELCSKLKSESGYSGYAELFRTSQPRTVQ